VGRRGMETLSPVGREHAAGTPGADAGTRRGSRRERRGPWKEVEDVGSILTLPICYEAQGTAVEAAGWAWKEVGRREGG